MLRNVQRKIPLVSRFNVFFFQCLCRSRVNDSYEISLPPPSQFWNTSSIFFFSQGRNFSCSFMTPDYWSNSVCNAVLEPFNQNRDICVAPTETNRKFSSLEFPLISDCEESESLILWNQQGNAVDTIQLPVLSVLSFISPSLCLFQIIAYFIMSQFKFQALWLKTVSLFEFLKFIDFGTQKPVRRGELRKLRTTV